MTEQEQAMLLEAFENIKVAMESNARALRAAANAIEYLNKRIEKIEKNSFQYQGLK